MQCYCGLPTVQDQDHALTAQALRRCVAICSVGELFGGVERHILGILSGFRARGVTALLLLFHDGELAAQAREQGIEPVILPDRNRRLLATSRQLARILEQREIRVIHVHGYKATVFCTLARLWYPCAMVKTEHGLPEPMSGRPMRALRDRLYHLLDSAATRMAGATVCYVTKELLAHYQRAHSGLQVMTIPNGVASMDRHQLWRPPELHEDRFNLAVVGRLDTVKGQHLAIRAVAAEGLHPDLHLYIVGVGPCESELRELAETHRIAHRVHFLGFRRNVYDYIAHCHALLMPSLHEGLPYTLLEAMALGTPLIASRVGGLAEVLQDGVTALLIPPGDATALAQAIVRLHDDPELRRRLGEHAQRLQQARYSLEAMAARYLGVYRRAL
jgi:glycosyltransferase involved in cell wall biosynthesis